MYPSVTVFGLGKSGEAAARRLAALGAKVFVTESKSAQAFAPGLLDELSALGIQLEFGGHTARAIEATELIVVSPGIHLDIPVLEKAKEKNIPLISEIELAFQLLKKPIIAVTGTNGKTTTTTLVGVMLKAAGKKVAVAGNIGSPLAAVDDRDLDYVVAEISSYQLETIKDFKPFVSAILNIQEDHLERHHDMKNYIAQKARIFENQTAGDFLVYNAEDPAVREMIGPARAKKIPFTKEDVSQLGCRPQEIKIPGRHNLENALAAATVASLCNVDPATIASILRTFPGVPHRIEYVAEIDGVLFYNDSKGTNPDSTLVAIETFIGEGMILVLGGRDKGVSLDKLCQAVKRHVKEVVLIGEAAGRFENALRQAGYQNLHRASNFKEMIETAFNLAAPGDLVLLSPACASFDMFNNYEERGETFKQLVREFAQADDKAKS